MPIAVKCKCGKAFKAPDSFLNKTVKCPACAEPLEIKKPLEPIKVKCPHCKKGFKAPPKYQGQKVNCPSCKGPILVPKARVENPDEFDIEENTQEKAVRKCSSCNAKVEEDDKLCVICGTVLSSGVNLGKTHQGMEDAGFKEKSMTFFIAIGLFAVLGGVGYFAYDKFVADPEKSAEAIQKKREEKRRKQKAIDDAEKAKKKAEAEKAKEAVKEKVDDAIKGGPEESE